jgi:hypothetical protein
MLFANAKRNEVWDEMKKNDPDTKVTAVGAKLGELWRAEKEKNTTLYQNYTKHAAGQ